MTLIEEIEAAKQAKRQGRLIVMGTNLGAQEGASLPAFRPEASLAEQVEIAKQRKAIATTRRERPPDIPPTEGPGVFPATGAAIAGFGRGAAATALRLPAEFTRSLTGMEPAAFNPSGVASLAPGLSMGPAALEALGTKIAPAPPEGRSEERATRSLRSGSDTGATVVSFAAAPVSIPVSIAGALRREAEGLFGAAPEGYTGPGGEVSKEAWNLLAGFVPAIPEAIELRKVWLDPTISDAEKERYYEELAVRAPGQMAATIVGVKAGLRAAKKVPAMVRQRTILPRPELVPTAIPELVPKPIPELNPPVQEALRAATHRQMAEVQGRVKGVAGAPMELVPEDMRPSGGGAAEADVVSEINKGVREMRPPELIPESTERGPLPEPAAAMTAFIDYARNGGNRSTMRPENVTVIERYEAAYGKEFTSRFKPPTGTGQTLDEMASGNRVRGIPEAAQPLTKPTVARSRRSELGAVSPQAVKEVAEAALNIRRTEPPADLEDIYRITSGKVPKAKKPSILKQLQTSQVSEFTPVRDIEAIVYKQKGIPYPDVDIARQMEMVPRGKSKAYGQMLRFQNEVIDPVINNVDDLNAYIALARIKDRLSNDKVRKAVEGYDEARADRELKEMEKFLGPDLYKRISDVAKGPYQDLMDSALQLMVTSGRMSQEVYKEIKKDNDFYAPFKVIRHMTEGMERGEGRSISNVADYTKAIKGIHSADFQIKSIVQQSVEQLFRAHVLVEKNLAMQRLAGIADPAPDAAIRRVDLIKTGPVRTHAPTPREGYEIVQYLEDGEPAALEVPREVAKAIQGLTPPEVGLVGRAAQIGSRTFAWGATTANMGFQVANLLSHDPVRRFMISRYGINNPVQALRMPFDYIHALYASLRGNRLWPGKTPDPLYLRALDSGVLLGTIQEHLTPERFRSELKIPARTFGEKGVRIALKPLDVVARLGKSLEETGKIASLNAGWRIEGIERLPPHLREKAIQRLQSEVAQYGGSPDFIRHGSDSRVMGLGFPFYNAKVQDVSSDLARLAARPSAGGKKAAAVAWARSATLIGIPATFFTLMNLSDRYRDDYLKRPKREREDNFMWPTDEFIVSEDGEVIRVFNKYPMRGLPKLFKNLVEESVRLAIDEEPASVAPFANEFLEYVAPVSVSGRNASERIESVASSTHPFVKGLWEYGTNRNSWLHRDTVPQKMEGASPENQYRQTTPDAYIKAGEVTGQPPLKLKQLAETLTGGAIRQVLPDKPMPGQEASSWAERALFRRFKSLPFTEDEAAIETFKESKAREVDARLDADRAAHEEWQAIRGLPQGEQIRRMVALRAKDPKAAEYLQRIEKEERLGFTDEDRRIRQLGVESQERARYISEKMRDMDEQERNAYVADLAKKGLLGRKAEVLKQAYRLRVLGK